MDMTPGPVPIAQGTQKSTPHPSEHSARCIFTSNTSLVHATVNEAGHPFPAIRQVSALELCLCTRPYQAHASCRSTQPAHWDVDHLVNELQLGKYHGPQTSLDLGKPPLHHDKDDTTIFSASCNCGSTNVLSTATPENLHDPHNRETGHRVNEIGNLFGPTPVCSVGSRFCASTGM